MEFGFYNAETRVTGKQSRHYEIILPISAIVFAQCKRFTFGPEVKRLHCATLLQTVLVFRRTSAKEDL